jgi:hypothetical protein
MTTPRIPFRRRQFFIKQGFQARFAIFPVLFLAVFLAGAGGYLYWYLKGFLEFELYLSHSRLQNPWHEIAPVLTEVVSWGGGALLLVLALWVWRRFGTLHRDLDRLADWVAAHARGQGEATAPALGDREVRALGDGLQQAMAELGAWDERVRRGVADVMGAAGDLQDIGGRDRAAVAHSIAAVRDALEELQAVVGEVAVDEGLS